MKSEFAKWRGLPLTTRPDQAAYREGGSRGTGSPLCFAALHESGSWPEPEATLAAGGVRCLGSTCRRSVGPNPPLVTHCGRGAKKHGAVQQGVGTYGRAPTELAKS